MSNNSRDDHPPVPTARDLADRRLRAHQIQQGPAIRKRSDALDDIAQKAEWLGEAAEWLGAAAPWLRSAAEWLRKAAA
jgi:hypothetical protein